jgi:protein-S-isoprenylcysteine O-methyltransferase Ste14
MLKTSKADWYFIIPASLIWVVALALTAVDFVRHRKAGYHFGFVNAMGLGLMVAGVAVRLAARKALRRQFSYALRILDDHKLVQSGIYRYVRHPAYAGDLMFHFGVPLLFSSSAGFLVMQLLIPCFVYRMGLEENMLIEAFGHEYGEYIAHSKRLIPYLY